MIEKLKPQLCASNFVPPTTSDMFWKINELVLEVNSLRSDVNTIMGYIAPEDGSEPRKYKTVNEIEQNMLAELERKLNAIVDAAINAVNELKGAKNE